MLDSNGNPSLPSLSTCLLQINISATRKGCASFVSFLLSEDVDLHQMMEVSLR